MRRLEDAFATITVSRRSNGGYKIHVQGTNIKPLVFGSSEEEEIKDAISGAFGKRYGSVVDKALSKAKEHGSSDFQVRLPQEVAVKELQKYNEKVRKSMRKAKKEEKKQEENQTIDITKDVKINEDTVLEAGDKIEILGKEKVDEKKLKEDDYKTILTPMFQMLKGAYNKGDMDYVKEEMVSLFDDLAGSMGKYDDYDPLYSYLADIVRYLDRK